MPKISPAAQRARIEERKVQILNAAAQVFAEKGFERATIAAIARQA
ncbi:MAG TPA: TetR family transcriptional regulator, partial [Anaerolineae bacterium]